MHDADSICMNHTLRMSSGEDVESCICEYDDWDEWQHFDRVLLRCGTDARSKLLVPQEASEVEIQIAVAQKMQRESGCSYKYMRVD